MLEIIGHRGGRGLYPENTLPGFEHAIALGVDALELDVGMTRDGVLVVHHDHTLNPDHTRNSTGAWLEPPGPPLWTLDAATLSGFDVGRSRPGSKTAADFPLQEPCDGACIPTLAEVLALGRRSGANSVRFDIEVKLSPLAPDETAGPGRFARAVAAMLQAEGMVHRAEVRSFDWRVLHEIRKLLPELATCCLTCEQDGHDTVLRNRAELSPWTAGLDINSSGGTVPGLVHRFGGEAWSPFHSDLNREEIAQARALGIRVDVWTVNEVADMQALARLGVDGIITDYPDRAVAALAPWRCAAKRTS